MGNDFQKFSKVTADIESGKTKLIKREEYTKLLNDKIKNITFTGMSLNEAINILKNKGFNKHRIITYYPYLTKIYKNEVIIYSRDGYLFKEPEYF